MLQIFDLPGTNSVPATIVRQLVGSDTPLLHLLTCLLTYPQMWVRVASYEALAESGGAARRLLNESDGHLFILITERGLRDDSGQVSEGVLLIILEVL